jgi:HAD superfamily hydrolase (TIGR01490 family)
MTQQHPETRLVAPEAQLATWLLLIGAAALALRLWIARVLPITGDEAYFYWWGVFPDWGYYDHPPLVGWLIALMRWLIGDSLLAIRMPVLWLPLLWGAILWWGLAAFDKARASWAVLFFWLAPLNWLNVLITTDTPLVFWSALSVALLLRAESRPALDGKALAQHGLAGLFIGCAFLSKYFAVVLGLSYLVYFAAFRRERWPGLLLLVICSLPGPLINLAWNMEHGWSNIMFNAINRNETEVVAWYKPLLYLGMMLYLATPACAWLAWRHRSALAATARAQRLLACVAIVPLAFFMLLSVKKVIGLHWVLSFYPFLFALLALALPRDRLRPCAIGLAWFTALHVLAVIGIGISSPDDWKNSRRAGARAGRRTDGQRLHAGFDLRLPDAPVHAGVRARQLPCAPGRPAGRFFALPGQDHPCDPWLPARTGRLQALLRRGSACQLQAGRRCVPRRTRPQLQLPGLQGRRTGRHPPALLQHPGLAAHDRLPVLRALVRRTALPALRTMAPVDPPGVSAAAAASAGGLVLAAFDFDGTLTRGDSLLPFLRLALGWPRLLCTLLLCAPWLIAYALGIMGNQRAKARLLRVSLRGRGVAELERLAGQFTKQRLSKAWRVDALARLRQHQQAGHRCVIVSASPDIYLRSVARELGVAHLICTEMQAQNGALTGEMNTPNCHGEQKAIRLQAWITSQGAANAAGPAALPATLYAYGDSSGDAAMLRLANYAFLRGRPLAGQPATHPSGASHEDH